MNRFKPHPLRFLALASVCLATSACANEANSNQTVIQTIAEHPLSKEAVLDFYRNVAVGICSNEKAMEKARSNKADCLAHIQEAAPVCGEESLAKLPAVVSDFKTASDAGHTYARCLLP